MLQGARSRGLGATAPLKERSVSCNAIVPLEIYLQSRPAPRSPRVHTRAASAPIVASQSERALVVAPRLHNVGLLDYNPSLAHKGWAGVQGREFQAAEASG